MSMSNSAGQTIIITMHMSTNTGQRINWSMGRVITCSTFPQALTQTQTQTQTRTQKETRRHRQTQTQTDTDTNTKRCTNTIRNLSIWCTTKTFAQVVRRTHKNQNMLCSWFLRFQCARSKFLDVTQQCPNIFVNQTIGAQVVLCTVSCRCLSVSVSVCQCLCRERERQIETQTDTQTETQTDTPTDRRTDTHRRTHTDGHTDSRG